MNKIVFITGATSGFGKATAEKFAANKYDLVITGRREELLFALQKDLEKEYGIEILLLVFDVRNRQEVATVISNIPDRWKQIDILNKQCRAGPGQGLY